MTSSWIARHDIRKGGLMNSHHYVVYIYSSESSQQHDPLPHLDWNMLNSITKAVQNMNKNCIQIVTPNVPVFSVGVRCLIFELTLGLNSLGPGDAIWRQRSGSTLAEAMACCLTPPSHYLNRCWLILIKVQWHSSDGNFIRPQPSITKCSLKITYLKSQ